MQGSRATHFVNFPTKLVNFATVFVLFSGRIGKFSEHNSPELTGREPGVLLERPFERPILFVSDCYRNIRKFSILRLHDTDSELNTSDGRPFFEADADPMTEVFPKVLSFAASDSSSIV